MPERDVLDDEAIEAILLGRRPLGASDPLANFVDDVRSVADRPVPRPNAMLASVLSGGLAEHVSQGFSTDKGDLLVTAASNVNGPGHQVAGLPKWRKPHTMLPTGLFSGLAAKIAAGVLAGLTGITAAGAAGALPGPAQHAVADVINTISPINLIPDTSPNATVTVNASPSSPGVSVDVNTGGSPTTTAAPAPSGSSTGAKASVGAGTSGASAGASANVTTPSIPGLPNIGGLTGNLPGAGAVQIPSCVKDIVDLKTGQPKVPLSQVSSLVVNCVKTLMGSSNKTLPAGIGQCVNSILGMVGNVTPGSTPNISGLDINSCIPVDVTKCMSSVMSMVQGFIPGFTGFGGSASGGASTGAGGTNANASGFFGMGGIPGLGGGVPGLSSINLAGCVPFNLDSCLSSLFNMAGNLPGVTTGGVPGLGSGALPSVGSLNLGSCVPFGSLPNIPGLSMLSGFLPH